MDTFSNSDIALFVIQYLNVLDSSRMAQTNKRFYYLVHEYRRMRGPQLVAAASDNGSFHNDNNNNNNNSNRRNRTTRKDGQAAKSMCGAKATNETQSRLGL
jgi:hypothetical protein